MKNIQIILNAILSKDRFEYVLVSKEWKIIEMSLRFNRYFIKSPQIGDYIVELLPEFIGSQKEIEKIFSNPSLAYKLESIYKNEQYVNFSVEHYNESILLVLLHNVTDMTHAQQKLLQYNNESILLNNTLQKILDSQNALLFVVNNNKISYANNQFMKYFGIQTIADLRRKNLKIYHNLDASLQSYDKLFEYLNSKEEYVNISKDTFILKATQIEANRKLFTLTKITKLTNKIQTDALTGAYKKTYFNTQVEKMLRNNNQGILVVFDIDNFKRVNDQYGHQAGDDVLIEFVSLIQRNIHLEDIFARWGGEEFLLLLQHTTSEDALKKIENLRTVIDAHTFKHTGHMTASFGMAKKEKNDDLHSLLQRADKAVYVAKKAGKNCVKFKKL